MLLKSRTRPTVFTNTKYDLENEHTQIIILGHKYATATMHNVNFRAFKITSSLTVNCPSQETEVTSTPTRPVDNIVTTTKGLQNRNNCLMERRWKIEVS